MTVVVATDFSPEAARVATVGAALAQRLGATLRVVHVSTDLRAPAVLYTPEEHLLTPDRQRLEAEAIRLRATGATVETELCAGPIADAVSAAAERVMATVLVMAGSRRGRAPLRRGTVERVARQVRVPLMVVRSPEALDPWLAGTAPLGALVGSDLGASSTRALQFVSTLRRIGPVVPTLLCVATPAEATGLLGFPPPPDPDVLPDPVHAVLQQRLVAQGQDAGVEGVSVRVLPGSAAPEAHLAVLAANENTQLVVVGGRSRAWLDAVWQGSVSRGLLRDVSTNLVLVPRGLGASHATSPRFRSVLVATDLSDLGDAAIPYGVALVAEGGTVHLAYVIDAGPLAPLSDTLDDPGLERQLLDRLPPAASARGLTARAHVRVGQPAEALVSLAAQLGVDALCLGSHGRSGLGAAVLGSVAQGVIARGPCPVLVVPRPRE